LKKEVSQEPVSADTVQFTYLYSEALKNIAIGNEEIAINQLIQCLSIESQSTASAYQLSLIFYKNKDFINAREYADFCLRYKPDNEWFLTHRSAIARELSEKTIYFEIYKKLVRLFPGNITYAYELAIICFDEKDYDQSLALLKTIEETIGVDENVSFLRNNIYYQQQRYDGIQSELLKLKVFFPDSVKYMDLLAEFYLNFNYPDKALNLYQNILELDKNNSNGMYGLSLIYAKTSKFTFGFDYLISILKSNKISIGKLESLASLYLDAPAGTFTNNQIDSIYSNLVEIKGISIDFINDYLAFLYNLKQLTDTERIAKVFIKSRPENYWSWDYLFNIFLVQSRFEDLMQYSRKALEYFPNHAKIYFYYGYSLFVLKKYSEAISYFESGLDYTIESKELEQQFILSLAESYHIIGKHKKSDEYFDRYLQNDSSNAYLLNNYAYYLTQRNTDLDKAEILSQKSIEIEPFNSTFLDTYAWIQYSKMDYQKALNYIQRSYRYGGNKNPIIIEHYGDILIKMNNNSEALEKFNEALSLNKGNSNLIEKIRLLKK